MSDMTERLDHRDWSWLRPVGWGGSLALLLAPFIAMLLLPGSGVNWTVGDFAFLAMLLGIIGLALELVVRASDSWAYRGGATLALAAGSMLLVANGAVGYIGSEDNPYNLLFFGVLLIAVLGSAIARFRAGGMAWAMAAAGLAHAVVGGIGFPQDLRTGPITIVFTAMWLGAAWLFRRAAQLGAGR